MKSGESIFVFAGEQSADIHGAELISKIKQINPLISIYAVSGKEMQKHKIKTLLSTENFQIMGFVDIIFSLSKLIKNFFFLKKAIIKLNPKACIFIDYPDFSFTLQSALRKKGYKGKIIHYICPSVWAWRKNRIKKMKKNLDLLLCIYPFEKHFLQDQINTEYIGNPLIERLKNYKYEHTWPLADLDIIGIFPGSRKQEIEKNLPIQLQAAKEIFKTHPSFSFAISIAHSGYKKLINNIAENFKKELKEKLIFMPSAKNFDLMHNLKLALATSGTINLELAFHKVPTIVTYNISWIDKFILKNILKINLPFYCIVNIVAKKMIFPELYGYNLTKENLLYYVNKLLLEKSYKEKIIENCEEVIKLFNKNTIKKEAVRAIFSLIDNK